MEKDMLKRILLALFLLALGTAGLIGGVTLASKLYPEQETIAHTLGVGGGVLWSICMVVVILILSDTRPSRI